MDAFLRIPNRPAALLLAFLFLFGCSSETKESIQSIAGPTMGTTYSVKWLAYDANQAAQLQSEVDQLLIDINQAMSTYIADSELSRFNRFEQDEPVPVSNALLDVLKLAQDISSRTDGAFDVTVGPLVNLWGFGPDGRVISAPSDEAISALRANIGYQKLQILKGAIRKESGLYVDLSAIAKGYAVDKVAELLDTKGVASYLVEIGGELRAKGMKPNSVPWKVAVESPTAGSRQVQQVLMATDVAIATSGDYRNYFEEAGVRYSHTIDPATGKPINHKLASVTVLRPTCAEADALATAFSVMGEQRAYAFALANDIDAYFIAKTDSGFEELMTPGFKARLAQ